MIWIGDIDEKFLYKLIEALQKASATSTPAKLILGTSGGDADVAVAAATWLEQIPTTITATGYIYSAGVPILAAAKVRRALPNTHFMFHPTELELAETRLNAEKYVEHCRRLDRHMIEILARHTAKPASFWRGFGRDTKFWTADDALEWGLIDSIVDVRL